MNIYKLLRLAGSRRVPSFMKVFGLWALHVTGRRYIGIFFDPVLACNLRCRMCLFSDDEHRAMMHGIVSEERLEEIEKAFFSRAVKLQIGCSAEPTLYKDLATLVERGRKAGIPNISLITNGQLIAAGKVNLKELAANGLTEITLSMHGTRSETYEYLMPGAKFEYLIRLLEIIKETKSRYPSLKVRVNFTVNSMNVDDLSFNRFFDVWPAGLLPDIVQLRPVQDLGDSSWKDFDMQPLLDKFDATIGHVAELCHQKDITCISPDRNQVSAVPSPQDGISSLIEDVTYYYISPDGVNKPGFSFGHDTFSSYHKNHGTSRRLFLAIFGRGLSSRSRRTTKKLNYTVK